MLYSRVACAAASIRDLPDRRIDAKNLLSSFRQGPRLSHSQAPRSPLVWVVALVGLVQQLRVLHNLSCFLQDREGLHNPHR